LDETEGPPLPDSHTILGATLQQSQNAQQRPMLKEDYLSIDPMNQSTQDGLMEKGNQTG
jgi:hypothetical protein